MITLLTDFGLADHFVAAMKGVILSRDPGIRIVDITHEVPPQDIETASFLLSSVFSDFPPGTVHVVVVDPGVGSARRALAGDAGGHYFVGPDNGVLDRSLARTADAQVRAIENPELRRDRVSRTFHGRDVFAPAAAALASGFPFAQVGPPVADRVRLADPSPERQPDGSIRGRILHVDRFGNGITSFTPADLPDGAWAYRYLVGDGSVTEVREFYAAGPAERPFAIWGSTGYLEIAVDGGSAAALLGFAGGDPVVAEGRGG